jgi:hypothetical protein
VLLEPVVDHDIAILVDDPAAQQWVTARPVDLDEVEVVAAVKDCDTVPVALRDPEHLL